MSEKDRALGRRIGKAPEKSNFAQACTLLSQYLKENRSLGNPETKDKTEIILASVKTKNFLTNIEGQQTGNSSSSSQNGAVTTTPTPTTTPIFQKIAGFATEEDSNKADLMTKTTSRLAPQMTIFYSGQVLVFNDLPAEKASEIIALAKKGCSTDIVSGSASNPIVVESLETIDLTKLPSSPPEGPSKKNISEIISIDINKTSLDENENNADCGVVKSSSDDETLRKPHTQPANVSDLPIARRNSLHRFLEKRKDRVGAKAPYQVPNRPGTGQPKLDEGSSRGAECSEKQLELKL